MSVRVAEKKFNVGRVGISILTLPPPVMIESNMVIECVVLQEWEDGQCRGNYRT
jgi:hypothetical protein